MILLVAITLSGCSDGHYSSIEEFDADIKKWNITGKHIKLSKDILLTKEFKCKDHYCYKNLEGFPCNQRLRIAFIQDNSGNVTNYEIWEKDGTLPSQCL